MRLAVPYTKMRCMIWYTTYSPRLPAEKRQTRIGPPSHAKCCDGPPAPPPPRSVGSLGGAANRCRGVFPPVDTQRKRLKTKKPPPPTHPHPPPPNPPPQPPPPPPHPLPFPPFLSWGPAAEASRASVYNMRNYVMEYVCCTLY